MTAPASPLYRPRCRRSTAIRDAEQSPPGQLAPTSALIERRLRRAPRQHRGALRRPLHRHLRRLGHPLPRRPARHQSHLKGDPRTLRADVAARSRCAGARARSARSSRWPSPSPAGPCTRSSCASNLAWTQHLNHQRPDAGGAPPLRRARDDHRRRCAAAPCRCATRPLLASSATPFDPFAHTRRREAAGAGARAATTCRTSRSSCGGWRPTGVPVAAPVFRAIDRRCAARCRRRARFAVRFDLHPLGEPVLLFNTHRFQRRRRPARASASADAVPGPMPTARLTQRRTDRPSRAPTSRVDLQRARRRRRRRPTPSA